MWNQLKVLAHKGVVNSIIQGAPIPIHVEIEPTEICNHACVFCHWHGDIRKNSFKRFDFRGNRSLEINRFLKLVDELEDMGTKAISFTGVGDPLMHPKIEKMLEKIASSKMEFAVTSNLNMDLSDQMINLLSLAKWIRISLDAGSDSCYKKIHNPKLGRGFSDTLDNIKRLTSQKRKAKVNVSLVICEQNSGEIIAATKSVKECRVDSISFRPDTGFTRTDHSRSYDESVKQDLEKAKSLQTEGFKVFVNYERLDENKMPNENIFCYYSNHAVYVAATGDVYPCCMTRYNKKYIIGNILNTTFNDFWFSNDRKQNYKKINMRSCPPCRHTYDNEVLRSIYGDVIESDNFI